MEDKTKALGTTLVFATVAFLLNGSTPLGALLWPPAPMPVEPDGAQVAGFMAYTVVESLGFGLAAACLVVGWKRVREAARSAKGAWGAFFGVVWVLGNWVPHDNLHMANGMNINGLIALEFGFHATLILAGLLIARFLAHGLGALRAPGRPAPRPVQGAARDRGMVRP